MSKTRQEHFDGHVRFVDRKRAELAFLRQNIGLVNAGNWELLGIRWRNQFPNLGVSASGLESTWRKRKYYDRPDAYEWNRSGSHIAGVLPLVLGLP